MPIYVRIYVIFQNFVQLSLNWTFGVVISH